MAYINVVEWTPDQVTDWMKGLDDSMDNYVYSFTNNGVGGRQLLNIRPYELEQLGMYSIGHQEIVLEAVENLRNFHYNIDKENLQFMALHIASAASSLHRQLATHCMASKIETQILNDITRTIGTIKPLIGWLERAPFQGQNQFTELCSNMLRLGLEMAMIGQRDGWVQNPVEHISETAKKLERLANYIIQDITDPMLLQPASLNLVTLKKRESELGFNIEPNYHGIHRVTDIKYHSPAHNSGKVEDGDEIVQINYQTVVGWQYKSVLQQLRESLPDVLLTLKKRPKHTKIYGQIYMQPYRLPSKKRAIGTRWGENVPSPRAGLSNIPTSRKVEEKTTVSDTDSICSDILTPTDTKTDKKESRLYYPKPRAMLQRRHSICGDELLALGRADIGALPLWHERKTGIIDPSSPSLRDKSVSFGFGLEIAPRPTTCIGIATSTGKLGSKAKDLIGESKKLRQVPEASPLDLQSDTVETEQSKPGVSKVVPFDVHMKVEDYHQVDEKYTCNVENTLLETFEPIPFADEEEEDALDALRNTSEKAEDILEALDKVSSSSGGGLPHVEAVNIPVINRRGRLDKSHSTPAYDNCGEESETPPAIEPRNRTALQTPPVPPPRPRKQKHLASTDVPAPPPKPPGLMATTTTATLKSTDSNGSFLESRQMFDSQNNTNGTNAIQAMPIAIFSDFETTEVNELHTPTKSRTLTLKKKHKLALIAKRRNINLKLLGTGDIQGHLYRRTKDRRGVTFWARLYFVMLDTLLYGFRSKEALRASSVIFLPGFTVSLAKEVHSKPFAFKVYHSAKTFYFAAESQDALNQWIEFIRQAAIQLHPLRNSQSDSLVGVNTKDLFSETDSSGDESESVVKKNLCTPSPQGAAKDMASALSPASSKSSSTPTTSAKHDRRYLGSLRKLTKGSLPSFKSEKKPSSDIPVPTDQYRSYRKVPGGSFGIQIGTNTPGYHDTALHPFNANTNSMSSMSGASSASFAEHDTLQRKLSVSSNRSSILCKNFESNSLCSGPPPPPSSPAPTIKASLSLTCDSPFDNPNKSIRKIPYNFIHASNPNLVEFDFQTSKTLDYSLPKINPSNSWDAHQNIQGLVTLKDLMLQKQEEESQEMYNNRVLLGVEKKDAHQNIQSFVTLKDLMLQKQEEEAQEMYDNRVLLGVEKKDEGRKRIVQRRTEPDNYNMHQQTSGDGKLSKTQSRSLPKTPDYEISFKPDDENIKRTRTKEGLKLRDFGYELISGDEPLGGGDAMTLRQNSNTSTSSVEHQGEHCWTLKSRPFLNPQQFLHKQKKQHSSTSCSSTSSADFGEKRTGSFKKKSSERIFQFNKHASGSFSAAADQQHVTMTLPLNKKSSQSSERTDGVSGGIKKSHTYNNDLKEKAGVKYEAHRKNSAPMPIFSKLSFSSVGSSSSNANSSSNSKTSKEKKLLGSPLLHRTIFGSQHHGYGGGNSIPTTPPITCTGREYDSEIFSQVIFPKISNNNHNQHHHHHRQQSDSGSRFLNLSSSNASIAPPDVVAPPPPTQPLEAVAIKNSNSGSNAATPEYPNMECPPVFEPEIYSLSDPNASLNLLLRRSNNNCNAGADEKQ